MSSHHSGVRRYDLGWGVGRSRARFSLARRAGRVAGPRPYGGRHRVGAQWV